MTARLYVDEDITPALARSLRRLGLDAVSAHELGNLAWPDELQLDFAYSEGRALLTCNCADYLTIARLWQTSGRSHSGIVLSYRQYSKSEIGDMTRTVARFLAAIPSDQLDGAVFVPDAFRVG